MFVLNIKLNFKKILAIVIAISILTTASIQFINKNNNEESLETANSDSNYDFVLTEENYIEMLSTIHENIDDNINKTIKMYGFVYKNDNFEENIFVCGMNTIIDSVENVAGIMCNSSDTNELIDNEWIEITGIITKGEYNGSMPIVKINSIKRIDTPSNTYVN